jgi:methionyl-tRNA formyltransferase
MRVVFMGTPTFAVPCLEALITGDHDVVGVITQPDRPSGRGKSDKASPVKQRAIEANIEVFQPESAKNQGFVDQLEAWSPDVAVVAAYGQILGGEVLDVPRHGCVNVHASLLPRHRGASPINKAIIEGDDETGVTIMRMDEGMDTGPMLRRASTPIGELQTAQQLHDELAELGAELLTETLDALEDGAVEPTPQDDDDATYAPLMSKDDGAIDWSASARRVADLIRGVNPWPGAYSFLERTGDRIKFHLAEPAAQFDGRDDPPGMVIAADDELVVATGDGAVRVLEIQAPGRRAMGADDFMNGYTIERGDSFEPEQSIDD